MRSSSCILFRRLVQSRLAAILTTSRWCLQASYSVHTTGRLRQVTADDRCNYNHRYAPQIAPLFAGTIKTVEMEDLRSKRWGKRAQTKEWSVLMKGGKGSRRGQVTRTSGYIDPDFSSSCLCSLCSEFPDRWSLWNYSLSPSTRVGVSPPPALSIERNWTHQVSYCQLKGLDIQYEEENSCCGSLKSTFYLTTFVEFTSEKRHVLTRRCRDYMLFYFSTQITGKY